MKNNGKIHDSSNRVTRLFDELTVGAMVTSIQNGEIVYVNDALTSQLNTTANYATGKKYYDIFWPEFFPIYEGMRATCRDKKEHTVAYYWGENRMWAQITYKMVDWESEDDAILLILNKIPEATTSEYEYQKLIYTDNITGLPNGKKLEDDVNQLVNFNEVALIYFVIENLEDIRELYGIEAGDDFLNQIKDWLILSENKAAKLYRIDDGLALLGRAVSMEDAEERCEMINERFKQPWVIDVGGTLHTIYSPIKIGIVFGQYVKNEMRNLLLRTIRLPVNGKGYALYNEDADRAVKTALTTRQYLTNCVQNNMEGFEVNFQPIIETETHNWIGIEALCRWTTPKGEPIPALNFIRIAEQLGVIADIDGWVMQQAMKTSRELGLDQKQFFLDVNFSPKSSIDDDFVESFLGLIAKIGYPPEKLNLEITEGAKIEFNDTNIRGLQEIREAGIMLSLDDFGTGYSSLENLSKVPVSIIKTEKMFIDRLENDDYQRYVLKLLVKLAEYQNIDVIAEGVETDGQLKILEDIGVTYMQGFYFSKPLTKKALANQVHRFQDLSLQVL